MGDTLLSRPVQCVRCEDGQWRKRRVETESRITEVLWPVQRGRHGRWMVYDEDDGFCVEPHPDRVGAWVDVAPTRNEAFEDAGEGYD